MRYIVLLFVLLFHIPCLSEKVYSASSGRGKSVLLKHIPLADTEKSVRKIFSLSIPGYPGAYNPSIVNLEQGFLLSFRYDDLRRNKSMVGMVRLNRRFEVVGSPVLSDTLLELEDMRLFWIEGVLYASGTRVEIRSPTRTAIALCQVDVQTLKLKNAVDLMYHPQQVEKNWTPLVHSNSSGKTDLFYIYSHNPQHVLRVKSISTGAIEHAILPWSQKGLSWEHKWGAIRGGTPCVSIGDERLEFFHSSFNDKNRRWWVFGAMTFENSPPFRIKAISQYPIMAQGMYTTPLVPRFKKRTFRVAFPGGFVEVKKKKKTLFYLVYGENDSGIKVMVLDKKRLLANMKKVPYSERPYSSAPYRGSSKVRR